MNEVKMRAPKDAACASWNGVTYTVDKRGFVSVPRAAVDDLCAHGFVPVEQPAGAVA